MTINEQTLKNIRMTEHALQRLLTLSVQMQRFVYTANNNETNRTTISFGTLWNISNDLAFIKERLEQIKY